MTRAERTFPVWVEEESVVFCKSLQFEDLLSSLVGHESVRGASFHG